jgi:hypothetical protein
MLGRDFRGEKYRYSFNGGEVIGEIYGDQNYIDLGERGVDSRLGRLNWSIDPKTAEYPWQSPYAYFGNSPICQIDYLGLGKESTHTDREGNVIAVYKDGDKGVYKHENIKKGDKIGEQPLSTFGSGVTIMGETEFEDEFINPESQLPDGTIKFGTHWEGPIAALHDLAMCYSLDEIGELSKSNQKFDLKTNLDYAPNGTMTGRILEGKYYSARSAGNYLAGWNGKTGTIFGIIHLTEYQYMNLAGAYQKKQYQGKITYLEIVAGKTFGPAPYYGEIPYTGRMIEKGWNRK